MFKKIKERVFLCSTGSDDNHYTTRARVEIRKGETVYITNDAVKEYLNIRTLEGLTDEWVYTINLYLTKYLQFCKHKISKNKTIEYLQLLQQRYSRSTYRKKALQIRRFLQYLDLPYMDKVKIMPEPEYEPVRIPEERVEEALRYFRQSLQHRTLIMLGSYSGMRPTEIYRLKIESIDFDNNSIDINKSKTGRVRRVYFNPACKTMLKRYIMEFQNSGKSKYLFGKDKMQRDFRKSPIKVKQLRKYFIQLWHRRNGNPLMGEILLGHSTKNSVTLRHYLKFSNDEIKKEYERVMS